MVQISTAVDTQDIIDVVAPVENQATYVRMGEERDIRLAKRNIDSYDRFLLLISQELARLPSL